MRPLVQGQLDGLCGIYAAINATRLIGSLTQEESQWLFHQACRLMESRKSLATILGEGLNSKDLAYLFRELIERRHSLIRFKPFSQAKNVGLERYWRSLKGFLESGERRAVILVLGNWDWGHWSVVRKASKKTLFLFDSDKLKVLNRRHCTTSEATKTRPIILYPSLTYFLERKP